MRDVRYTTLENVKVNYKEAGFLSRGVIISDHPVDEQLLSVTFYDPVCPAALMKAILDDMAAGSVFLTLVLSDGTQILLSEVKFVEGGHTSTGELATLAVTTSTPLPDQFFKDFAPKSSGVGIRVELGQSGPSALFLEMYKFQMVTAICQVITTGIIVFVVAWVIILAGKR